MSLAKVPVTLLVSYAFKLCMTPPNRPPPMEERFKTNLFDRGWYWRLPGPAGSLQFLFGILEAATILAWNYRRSALSQAILSLLILKGGRPEHLRLSATSAIGGFLMLAGSLLRLTTFRYLGKFFRFEASIQHDHQLITDGPYAYVRHPSYTGGILAFTGWVLWYYGEGSWFRESGLWNTFAGKLVILSYFVGILCGILTLALLRMEDEDHALRKRFGKDWDEWAKRVPYLLIPGVY